MTDKANPQPPRVRLAHPKNRPIQLRYRCPIEGREIRISTNTYDESEALEQKLKLEAKLLLGIDAKPRRKVQSGRYMSWEGFREQFRTLHLSTLRANSELNTECRLNLVERILKPRTLADVADSEALHELQAALLAGDESKLGRPRSPHTVKGYMAATLAAINWAVDMGWLTAAPRIRKLKVSKRKQMKGRPISQSEFESMLEATVKVTGERVEGSWHYVLRGLWESGLRLDELMHVSWDIPGTIQPAWPNGGHPVLIIPAAMQKNDTEEAIPLLPAFNNLLLETPPEARTGWAFSPQSLLAGSRDTGDQTHAGWAR